MKAVRVALLVVAGAVLLAVSFLLLGTKPRLPDGMLRTIADEREPSGYRQEGSVDGGGFAFRLSTLQSSQNLSASTSSGPMPGHRWRAADVAVINTDDSLVMQRIGFALFELLRDSGRFETIRYLPAGARFADGERLPDLFVTLELNSWDLGGIPGYRSFDGQIAVRASDRFMNPLMTMITEASPYGVELDWRAVIDYSGSQLGIENSAARYSAVSRRLAGSIAEQLSKVLDEQATKYGEPFAPADEPYPDYVAPPDFGFLAELDAQKLVDGSTLAAESIAVWRIADEREPSEVLAIASESLRDAAWTVWQQEHAPLYLRATRDNQVLEVFPEVAEQMFSAPTGGGAPARMIVAFAQSASAAGVR